MLLRLVGSLRLVAPRNNPPTSPAAAHKLISIGVAKLMMEERGVPGILQSYKLVNLFADIFKAATMIVSVTCKYYACQPR